MSTVVLQPFVALDAIAGGAEVFVEQVLYVADSFDLEPLLLSLVLAPFATELPEKANSFFWARDGKDSLLLGNIAGAMVFQSTPRPIGLAFTSRELDRYSIFAGRPAARDPDAAGAPPVFRRRDLLWTLLYLAFVAVRPGDGIAAPANSSTNGGLNPVAADSRAGNPPRNRPQPRPSARSRDPELAGHDSRAITRD